jgi:hypothetical protein
MPGWGRRWEPTKPLPWLAIAILIFALVDFAVDWLVTLTIDRWARQFPTANHWYQFHTTGGRTYYLSPSVGWYLNNDLWIYLGAIGLCFLIPFLYGVRWKRVR